MDLYNIFDEEKLHGCLLKAVEDIINGKKTNFHLKGLKPEKGKLTYWCHQNDCETEWYGVSELYVYEVDDERYFLTLEYHEARDDLLAEIEKGNKAYITNIIDIGKDDFDVQEYWVGDNGRRILSIFDQVDPFKLVNLYKAVYGLERYDYFLRELIYQCSLIPTDEDGNCRYVD